MNKMGVIKVLIFVLLSAMVVLISVLVNKIITIQEKISLLESNQESIITNEEVIANAIEDRDKGDIEKVVEYKHSIDNTSVIAVSLGNSIESNIDMIPIEEDEVEYIEEVGEIEGPRLNYFSIFTTKLNKLKSGDLDTVKECFGDIDIFSPNLVADRVSASTVKLISSEEIGDETELLVHICTIDYNLMNNDYEYEIDNTFANDAEADNKAKRKVAQKLIDGVYKVCYNIPVRFKGNQMIVSELFKSAITGGWYKAIGIELEQVGCIIV